MKSIIAPLAEQLRSGQLTSVALTERYIQAITQENATYNAYVHTTFEEALRMAKQADEKIQQGEVSPLCGLPMTLKDNIATDGLLTTCCSNILQGFRPYYDATVWQKLKSKGAVLLGKTNMDEFAMGSTSESSCYGAPKNPHDVSKVSGGSSGGGGTAVAANLCTYALGSDTGGSIRQPASFCGVVGFKPTYGAVSRYGLIAYGSSLDQIGPIAQSVSDVKYVFDAICGKDERDQTSLSLQEITPMTGDIHGKKIGVVKELMVGLQPEVKCAVEHAIECYAKGGAEIVELSIPALSLALPVYYILACAEASSNLGRYDGIRYGYRAKEYTSLDDMVIKTRSQGFGKEVQKRILLGTYVLSSGYYDAYYKKACLLREQLIAKLNEVFQTCDVLFAPSVPRTAFDLGYAGGNALEMYQSDMCTVPVNIAGLPALSLPCGVDQKGLPIGLQLIGNRGQDYKVLSFGYYAERENLFAIPSVKGGVSV